jgi:hypothetical protein
MQQRIRRTGLSEKELRTAANYFFAYHEWMIYLAQSEDRPSPLRERFDKHLKTDASEVAVLSETFESYDHLNVQRALDRFLSKRGRKHDLLELPAAGPIHCPTSSRPSNCPAFGQVPSTG